MIASFKLPGNLEKKCTKSEMQNMVQKTRQIVQDLYVLAWTNWVELFFERPLDSGYQVQRCFAFFGSDYLLVHCVRWLSKMDYPISIDSPGYPGSSASPFVSTANSLYRPKSSVSQISTKGMNIKPSDTKRNKDIASIPSTWDGISF